MSPASHASVVLAAALAAGLALAPGLSGAGSPPAATPGAARVLVLGTGDARGWTEPCG